MFENLKPAPPDAILGLNEAFRNDPNPEKINLSVGVYKDARGRTPVLGSVKEAERRLLNEESTKSYLAIDGLPMFGMLVRELLFGADHEIVNTARGVTIQTPGGTGALRVASDFIRQILPSNRVWCSRPTWPNHPKVFAAAGLDVDTYPYFDAAANGLAFDEMMAALKQIPEGDVVCLHACCHNPTGVDPTAEQWEQIADVVFERGLLPLLDFAYQGFGDGLQEDAAGLRTFCRPGRELLVASSFSKNFGLYNERVGALTLIAGDSAAAATALSQAKACVRANYSNPPAHGGAIVATILSDPQLRQQWQGELADMRNRINAMRRLFADTLAAKAAPRDFSFLKRGRGMFAYSGLTAEQVDALRERHSIYAVRDGRVNVGGMTESNMDQLCSAVISVL